MGAQIILGNSFHLCMRPGLGVMQHYGGLYRFENWSRPVGGSFRSAARYSDPMIMFGLFQVLL